VVTNLAKTGDKGDTAKGGRGFGGLVLLSARLEVFLGSMPPRTKTNRDPADLGRRKAPIKDPLLPAAQRPKAKDAAGSKAKDAATFRFSGNTETKVAQGWEFGYNKRVVTPYKGDVAIDLRPFGQGG
jgi:hypothetical protein